MKYNWVFFGVFLAFSMVVSLAVRCFDDNVLANSLPDDKLSAESNSGNVEDFTNFGVELVEDAKESAEPVEVAKESAEPVEVAKESAEPVEVAKESAEPVEVAKENVEPVEVAKENIEPVEVAKESAEPVEVAKEDVEPVEVASQEQDPLAEFDKILEKASRTPGQFKLEVKTDRDLYYVNDPVKTSVYAQLEGDYYLFLFGVRRNAPELNMLFPNEGSKSNLVRGGETLEIPDPNPDPETGDSSIIYVDEAYGVEQIVAFATKKPLKFDSEDELKEFVEWLKKLEADDPTAEKEFLPQLKSLAYKILKSENNGWAIASVKFKSLPSPEADSPEAEVQE